MNIINIFPHNHLPVTQPRSERGYQFPLLPCSMSSGGACQVVKLLSVQDRPSIQGSSSRSRSFDALKCGWYSQAFVIGGEKKRCVQRLPLVTVAKKSLVGWSNKLRWYHLDYHDNDNGDSEDWVKESIVTNQEFSELQTHQEVFLTNQRTVFTEDGPSELPFSPQCPGNAVVNGWTNGITRWLRVRFYKWSMVQHALPLFFCSYGCLFFG